MSVPHLVSPVRRPVPNACVAVGPAHVGEDGVVDGVEAGEVAAAWDKV